jgi:hypothetical protein
MDVLGDWRGKPAYSLRELDGPAFRCSPVGSAKIRPFPVFMDTPMDTPRDRVPVSDFGARAILRPAPHAAADQQQREQR